MKADTPSAVQILFDQKRLGQKNALGFYSYKPDKKGTPKKEVDLSVPALLAPVVQRGNDTAKVGMTDQEIIDRMMLPMIIECSRCLEDKIVSSPVEVDIGVIYGLGFPPFRGGVLRYADFVGLKALCEKADQYSGRLGKLYEPTESMRKLAESGKSFYG
jgi:3-hydroxyacyl-CoA dehydrogenase/enoyl-CoA hydratase/3-hydroxybutyryl-CoA epimerase/enoyl-CoA isomerase